jgi:hypothetical protein
VVREQTISLVPLELNNAHKKAQVTKPRLTYPVKQ